MDNGWARNPKGKRGSEGAQARDHALDRTSRAKERERKRTRDKQRKVDAWEGVKDQRCGTRRRIGPWSGSSCCGLVVAAECSRQRQEQGQLFGVTASEAAAASAGSTSAAETATHLNCKQGSTK